MKREKDNLISVHEIYIRKIRSKVRESGNNLDENSRRILMDSLMASHSKSFIRRDFQKNGKAEEVKVGGGVKGGRRSAEDREFKDSETVDEREVPLGSISEKTEELKSKLKKYSPKKRENIIRALEVRKKLVNQM